MSELNFNLNYRTNGKEALRIVFENNISESLYLTSDDNEHWHGTIKQNGTEYYIRYRYEVVSNGTIVRSEWGAPHSIAVSDPSINIDIHDRWQDQPADKPFYSQAFTNCINRRNSTLKPLTSQKGHVMVSIYAPAVSPDETLIITGSCDYLGNWDTDRAQELNDSRFPLWQINLDLDKLPHDIEYKTVIVKKTGHSVVRWEDGNNRLLSKRGFVTGHATSENGLLFNCNNHAWKGAGVAIPVFSLRTDEDCGIGDFYDLIPLVEWAAETGQKFVQILPINDTTMTGTWTDSYPYNANSTFALHPMYLRLQAMGELHDEERREFYRKAGQQLNLLSQIDYERVSEIKSSYTHELFEQDGTTVIASDEFKQFFESNKSWLKPYAAFCTLRDIYGTADYERWEQYARYDETMVNDFIKSHQRQIEYVYFLQYHLDLQLRYVSNHARLLGVAIKGDIPIGISRTSVDAWTMPRLFNLDSQAGAPPDDFSTLGQNWGFPTYNWEEMSLDGFSWWKSRFIKMAEYFDSYRIDHVLGFFRIWQIPLDTLHGLLGYFNPALPMSPEEIKRDYDFTVDIKRDLTPHISNENIRLLFGEFSDEAKAVFLEKTGDKEYRPRPQYTSQRAVVDHFSQLDKSTKNTCLCNGLLAVLDEVLFIEDPYKKGYYHPRIAANKSLVYKSLTDYERWCFDRLYEYFYYHRHNDFWYHKAMWKLPPLINATDMLTCAEDLGMIPSCVPQVMHKLQILSLEIQRMPKELYARFGDTEKYPYYSVCTTSTHDMSGIRGWWEENREVTQAFYKDVLKQHGEAPHFAEPRICELIIKQHLDSPSMLCIIPLQDWLSIDGKLRRDNPMEERINVPAESRHYWRYRMHLTIENLNSQKDFNSRLKTMINNAGR